MSINDITGDTLSNIKGDAEAYAKGWDAIWQKKFNCRHCNNGFILTQQIDHVVQQYCSNCGHLSMSFKLSDDFS